jgi:hypothetical protein
MSISQTGHECGAAAAFRVNGTGIPIIDEGVTVHERKDGPCSITRRAEVNFPITDGAVDWINIILAYEDLGPIQQAEISMMPVDLDGQPILADEQVVLRGHIGRVGSRGAVNTGHVTIMGPFDFLSEIPAGNTFPDDATLTDYLQWVVDRFETEQPVYDDVSLGDVETFERPLLRWGQKKSFTQNRDTLADVVKFVMKAANRRIWFEPTADGGIQLHAVESPGTNYNATNDDGDVFTIHNNALFELRPFNAVTLKGNENHVINLGDFGTVNTHVQDSNYHEATAWYPPLVERAGGRIARESVSEFAGAEGIERDAVATLKEMLDTVTGGNISMALAPFVTPFDTLDAKPSCEGTINTEVPTLTYEVQRAAHTLSPHDPGAEPQIPHTVVDVGMEIDPARIQVSSTEKRTTVSEGGENEPLSDDPSSGFSWGIGGGS